MAGDMSDSNTLYSPGVGLIYIFNLIIGTGALAMPKAFSQAGWLISVIFIFLLSFMSYLTATFVIEAMASANAIIRWEAIQRLKRGSINSENAEQLNEYSDITDERRPLLIGPNDDDDDDDDGKVPKTPTTNYYEISKRFEMGKMAEIFFHKIGTLLFYICISLYLYGDLSIYGTAVPKSLRDLLCTVNETADSSLCWNAVPSINRANAYRLFVAIFILVLGPFTFFNVQKTKYLQILTTFLRWLAFLMMIVLAVIRLAQGHGSGKPPLAKVLEVPNLFGVCVYAFMCHHSLPSLITPFSTKRKLFSYLLMDYLLILSFYSVMSFTGIFAFDNLHDLYTLNFQPSSCATEGECATHDLFIQYFLVLFPVFTLSTNFPIISITLQNNLKTLFLKEGKIYHWFTLRLFFPLLAIVPPTIVALCTESVEVLVGITGAYAGAGIQYVVPAALVFFARKRVLKSIGNGLPNQYASPFKQACWIFFVFVWTGISLIFVTINLALPKSSSSNATFT